jgi:uncharacterized phage infection (PIP) family protein YhgE
VKKVNDIISEIATASEEQSTGIKQVNQAVMQIDETVQQNAALVEQAAAAAESLREQSAILNKLMDSFNTGDRVASSPGKGRPASAGKPSGGPNPAPQRRKAAGDSGSWAEF